MEARRFVHDYCIKLSKTQRLECFKEIAKSLEIEIPNEPTKEYAPLSWHQIKELVNSGYFFGAHACSHEILSTLNYYESYNEVSQSKKRIEEIQKEIEKL